MKVKELITALERLDQEAMVELEGLKFKGYIRNVYQCAYTHGAFTLVNGQIESNVPDANIAKLEIDAFPGWEIN